MKNNQALYSILLFNVCLVYSFVVEPQKFMGDRVGEMIRRHIPDAVVTHQHAAEVTYTLPYKDVNKFAGEDRRLMYR